MVTEYEARKLIHEMRDDLHVTPGVALRYIPGALLFFAFALAGLLTDQQPDAAREAAAVPHHERASIAESRRVLDERRKRFEARALAQAVQRANAAEIDGAIEVDAFASKARASD